MNLEGYLTSHLFTKAPHLLHGPRPGTGASAPSAPRAGQGIQWIP